jgi:hypothetical protein
MNTDLMSKYYELCKRKEVTNTDQYAYEWECLAADFKACDMPNMSDTCRGRAIQYRQLANVITGFVRVYEDRNFVRLEQI